MPGVTEAISNQYEAAVATWRAKVSEFQTALATFVDNRTDAVALGFGTEWNEIYSRAVAIQSTLSNIAGGLSSAYSWISDVFGLGGLRGLGFVPAIPIAIITGSIATLAYFINQLYQFNQKIAFARTMNYSPEQVNQLLDAGGILGNSESKSILATVLIGGAVLYFVPRLMKGK